MSDWVDVAALAAALSCGLVGGVFFAFSTFVMAGLGRLPAAEGLGAMQAINRAAPRPAFMSLLFGAVGACLAVAVWALADLSDDRAPWLLAGAAVYVVGSLGVTMAANVPRNVALERGRPEDWDGYRRSWVAWNHVRLVASAAASVLLVLGLVA